jgi:hypothetical protein
LRNRRYLHTKQDLFGHVQLIGDGLPAEVPGQPVDIGILLGAAQPSAGRPVHLVGNVILIAANLSPPAYFAINGESRTAAGHA